MKPEETFAEWQFRVKPYTTAAVAWARKNLRWTPKKLEYKSGN